MSTPIITDLEKDVEKDMEKSTPLGPLESTRTDSSQVSLSDPVHPAPMALSLPHEIVFVSLICSAHLLTQAGFSPSIIPVHIIGESFGTFDPGQLSWFAAAFSLTVGTFILIAGRLGDMYGHKLLFISGFSWYSLWSIIAGLSIYSRSQIFFDFCRAMQGIGPAMLLPNALAILAHTYPQGPKKNMAFALFGATAPLGFVLGAIFSGLLAQLAWWPWAYWCMGLVCPLVATGAYFAIPGPTVALSAEKGTKSFDFIGSITGIAGLVLFNVAWNEAPIIGWNSPAVIVLLILGLGFFVAFVLVERRVAQPILPLKGLSAKVWIILGCIALGWASFGIWVYYLIQFVEVLRHQTPLSAAATFIPSPISGLFASVATGLLLHKIGTGYVMIIAMTAFCIGNVLLATMPVDQSFWIQTFLSIIIMPFGMDMSFPSATILLSDFVPKDQQGIAASLVSTILNYSISIGLGIAGTVEVHVQSGGTDILGGYRAAWYAAIGLSGCGILLSIYCVLDGYKRSLAQESKS